MWCIVSSQHSPLRHSEHSSLCHPERMWGILFLITITFYTFQRLHNIHLLFMIYRISSPLLINTITSSVIFYLFSCPFFNDITLSNVKVNLSKIFMRSVEIEKLNRRVKNCQRCGLVKTRSNAICGEGNLHA